MRPGDLHSGSLPDLDRSDISLESRRVARWGMTTSTAYTPLEALLFFQSLPTIGVEPSSFSKISDLLKENEFVREAKTFDAGRLSPDSLRELYLNLLKDETRSDNELARPEGPNVLGDGQPQTSRKRKLSTPPLASVSDAARHIHLLPQLVARLYARYRQHVIQEIREEERRYDSLQRDIEEIQRGKWDQRLERRHDVVLNETSSIRPGRRAPNESGNLSPFLNESPVIGAQTTRTPLQGKDTVGASKRQQSGSYQTIGANFNHGAGLDGIQSNQHGVTESSDYRRSEPVRYHHSEPTAGSSYLAQGDVHNAAQNIPRPPSQYGPAEGGLSFLPPPHQSAHGYRLGSSSSDSHRSLAFPQSRHETSTGPSQSPDAIHASAAAGHASASPVILPPPPGMHRTSGPSTGPLDALADMAGQQYRAQPPPQPLRNNQMSPKQHPQSQPSQARGYFQSPYQYPTHQPAYSGPYQTHTPQNMTTHYPGSSGPSPLPPFQSLPPAQAQSFGQPQQHQFAQQPHRSSLPPYVRGVGASMPSLYPQPYNPAQRYPMAGQQTPLSAPADKRQLYGLSPIDTSGSSTKWRNTKQSRFTKSPGSPTPPGPEDVSPISERAPSPEQVTQPDKKLPKGRKDELKRQHDTPEDVGRNAEERSVSGTGNRKARRGRGQVVAPGRSGRARARAGSTTSSAVAGSVPASTRSQSVISHVDELSMDTATVKARKIKNEPPATPAGVVGDEDTEMTETTPDEGSRMSTRKRRGTLRGSEVIESTGTVKKRKRDLRETPDDGDTADVGMPSRGLSKPNYVLASRNFPRTSATIMNDVSAHKLASMFAKPLTEREAPGYKDLTYRPQDLKSIKSAISAGSRAVAVAAETVGTPAGEAGSPGQGTSTPSSKSASLWIPKSADVIPPKGIVNSAQLEKELMRMFANAVMFNPDPNRVFGPAFKEKAETDQEGTEELELANNEEEEGRVVKDTREMFQAVEKSVSDWRAAERAAEDVAGRASISRLRGGAEEREEDDADELAGDDGVEGKDDEDGQSTVKRRRRV